MDFFANAFVTREVAADNENVVVKDGIQIREKVFDTPATISSSSDIVNCEICGVAIAKYKCPGCFCQTCSLHCSKQHKLDTTCTGVRSRTQFVDRKQYNEQHMMSDYNFLEEVGRTVDNAARDNVGRKTSRKKIFGEDDPKSQRNNHRQKRTHSTEHDLHNATATSVTEISLTAAQELEKLGSAGTGSYREKQLITVAKKRGTHLILIADGLKKRKENTTQWRDKPTGRILWTVEWLFPEVDSSRRVLQHKNDEAMLLKDILQESLSMPENTDLAEKYPADTLGQCQLFFLIPLRHANQPALYPLKNTDSLRQALRFKKVLEYPTILVLGLGASVAPSPCAPPSLTTPISSSSTTAAQTTITTSTSITTEPDSTSVIDMTGAVSEIAKESNNIGGQDMDMEQTQTENTDGSRDSGSNDHTAKTLLDLSHPVLKKYKIEDSPTHWPRKQPAAQVEVANMNKRPNNAMVEDGEEEPKKKAKLDGDGVGPCSSIDDSSSDAANSSSEDDEDSSESSSSEDSDDSDDEEGSKSSSGSSKNKSKGLAAPNDEANSSVTDERGTGTQEGTTHADFAIGQAILEAFNQDFGQSE
ncbi:Box C/D snoRNA protein 1 [Mortierella polycephala]|uniref:Box C/D snoRNA protein 1 n=1 Tax=Mortierella polycephala TaxID=41804 RepID=A0A9P6TVW8_9FUNG|nr:Box C/D snoRNA protein 1 [Mortierella polycephala]